MALKTYIGARYTPKYMGAWNKSSQYAALSVVYANNTSYVSRKTVPAETDIANTEYWMKSADWNAQVDEYQRQTEEYNTNVVQYNQNVQAYDHDVNEFFNVTMHSYPTKEDMVKDQTIKLGYTLLTCGDTAVGDGKGEYYKVESATSATAVALENGLFAVPFTMKEYNPFTGRNLRVTTRKDDPGTRDANIYIDVENPSATPGIARSVNIYINLTSLTASKAYVQTGTFTGVNFVSFGQFTITNNSEKEITIILPGTNQNVALANGRSYTSNCVLYKVSTSDKQLILMQ